MKKVIIATLALSGALMPQLAFAHDGFHASSALAAFLFGFIHPILGLDHLLAMICVGVLSSQLGGRAIWQVPATFVSAMTVGSLLGIMGMPLPFTELAIAASVLALGGAIVADKRLSVAMTMSIIALFGFFHGHAHGAEIPEMLQPSHFVLGFVVASTLIHLVGVWLGEIMTRGRQRLVLLRVAGQIGRAHV